MELIHSLGISWQLLLAQIINFGIVLFVLARFVYRPVLRVIDARRADAKRTATELERALKASEDADRERVARLRKADAEAGKILEAAKKQAEATQSDILERARQEAQQIVARGNQAVAEERNKALADVQDTVAKTVITLTESLLRREFSPKDQKQVMEELTAKIPALLK